MSNVSNNGGKYGQRQSTLNIGCRPRNSGMLSWKELSPTALVMLYGPYQGGKILQWGPARRSFYKCSQTLSPTWNLCSNLERGYGLLRFGEIFCSCGGHRGGFHPIFLDPLSCTSAECVRSSC